MSSFPVSALDRVAKLYWRKNALRRSRRAALGSFRHWDREGESALVEALNTSFDGKDVAIVGNAPNTLGRGFGPHIDAHDLVVRLNLVIPTDHASDLGQRTDFRFVGCTLLDRHRPQIEKLENTSTIITTEKNVDFYDTMNKPVTVYDRRLPQHVMRWLKPLCPEVLSGNNAGPPPRSGVVFLALLLAMAKPVNVVLYGFSQTLDDATTALHYDKGDIITYEPDDYKRNHCDPSLEIRILLALQQRGLIGIN